MEQQQPTIFGSMWKYKWLTFTYTLAALGAAWAFVDYQPPAYEATAEMVVEDPLARSFFDLGTASSPERYLADQAAIIRSPIVARRAIEIEPGLGELQDVLADTEVITFDESSLIQIVYQAGSSDLAISGANAIAEAYTDVSSEAESREVSAALEEIEISLAAVDETLGTLQTEIESAVSEDPAAQDLQRQLTQALQRQVELQSELPEASELRQAEIRTELQDIGNQLDMMGDLQNLSLQDPTLVRLFEEQSQAIARKTTLLESRDELRAEARRESTGVVLFSPAPFTVETGIGPATALVLGLAVGLAIAAWVTYMLANSRRRFESRTDPEAVLGAPLVAEIPRFRAERIKGDVPVVTNPGSVASEGFRFIATTLAVGPDTSALARDASHLGTELARVIAVVSAGAGDGKSVVVANTAIECARQGTKVLAIDADFGQQKLANIIMGGEPEVGITEIMHQGMSLQEAVRSVKVTSGLSLDLLGRGTASFDTPDWFGSLGAKSFFAEVNREYDLVLLDTPPLLRVAYATSLVRFASGVLVVITHRSKIGLVEDLADRLELLEAEIVGYAYNRAPLREGMYAASTPMPEARRATPNKRASSG